MFRSFFNAIKSPAAKATFKQASFEDRLDKAANSVSQSMFSMAGVGLVGGLGYAFMNSEAHTGLSPGQLGLGILGAGVGLAVLDTVGPRFIGHAAKRLLGNIRPGTASVAGSMLIGAGGAALRALKGAELTFRTLFTGGIHGTQRNWVDAYFPFAKHSLDSVGLAKFAPNPRIMRRMTGLAALGGLVGSSASELISNHAPPPTIYYDGVNIRKTNDWGADASYAQAMLGKNSAFHLDRNSLAQLAMYT